MNFFNIMFSQNIQFDIKLYSIICSQLSIKVKIQWSRYRPGVAHRVGRGIALLFHDRGTRRGWVVSSTPRPHFTPRERPGTHFTGGWVDPRPGLDGRKISSPPGFDPGPSSPYSVVIPTELPCPPIIHRISLIITIKYPVPWRWNSKYNLRVYTCTNFVMYLTVSNVMHLQTIPWRIFLANLSCSINYRPFVDCQ